MESLQDPFPNGCGTLTFVTLFENEVAGHRAQQTLASLIDGVDPDTIVLQQRWSFDMLAESDVGVEGWLEEADVILVAGARDREMPAALLHFFERTLASGVEKPTALVALGLVPAADGDGPRKLFTSLEMLSNRLGMRFFSSSAPLPAGADLKG